jgi:hypothetical protein
MQFVQVQHDQEIDWLELNQKGSHLLFRDRKCRLHLYDIAAGARKQLLQYVGYVQWVPDSDVIVVCLLPGVGTSTGSIYIPCLSIG